MDRDAAIQFALSRRPESIGMARLCQELLADVADEPVTAKTPVVVPVCSRRGKGSRPGARGQVRNPWGPAGKPK